MKANLSPSCSALVLRSIDLRQFSHLCFLAGKRLFLSFSPGSLFMVISQVHKGHMRASWWWWVSEGRSEVHFIRSMCNCPVLTKAQVSTDHSSCLSDCPYRWDILYTFQIKWTHLEF